MGDLLGLSVGELVTILKKKRARLPHEIGAFVTLETCEATLAGPAVPSVDDVRIGPDGAVSVFAPPNSATAEEAAKGVVALLAHVLVAAGPGVPPVLLRLVESGPTGGKWDLHRLRDDLEACLVPLNRQASRRVLSRMLREAQRDAGAGGGQARSPHDDVDADLDALIADGPAELLPAPAPAQPPAPAPGPQAGTHRHGDQIWIDEPRAQLDDDSLVTTLERPLPPDSGEEDLDSQDMTDDEPPPVVVRGAPQSAPPRPAGTPTHRPPGRVPPARALVPIPEPADPRSSGDRAARHVVPEHEDEPRGVSRRRPAPAPAFDDLEDDESGSFPPSRGGSPDVDGLQEYEHQRSYKSIVWIVLFAALIGAMVGGVLWIRPDAIDRFLGDETPEERIAEERARARREEQARILAEHEQRFGNLLVRVTPDRAQVLLYVGRGPAVAENMPVGVPNEFVAIAEGRAPGRAVLPADARWERTDEGERYELAMQGGDEEMAFEALELGASRLPHELGVPTDRVGNVRVVTNPPGAKVYLLIGFSPDVLVRDIRTDRPVELLVGLEGHVPQRAIVGPSDWRDASEGRIAEVRLQLVEREPVEEE